MHHARSSEEFKAMAKLCTDKWRDDKQNTYADWFSKVYLSDSRRATYPAFYPRKMRWSRITELSRRAVSGSSEPRPECPKGPFGHYCEGPLPSQMILRTLGHGATGVHWIKRDPGKQTGILRSVFFNTSTYMSLGEEVTQERVTRYCEAKDGRFLETDTIQDINLHFLSLHQVEFIGDPDQLLRFQFALQPVITMDKIKEIRELYRCDCKAFMSTGWACSHVVAAMSINEQFDLDLAATRLPTTKLSGGQRKIPNALTIDITGAKRFSTKLITRLQREPMYIHNWQVYGVETTEFITGRIKGAQMKNGVYQWRVKFVDGDELFYECQDIAEIIAASWNIGLDVTSLDEQA
ncbi:hypothetical protein PPTG_07032 [Phytophthora nicotianae INRA-310]|uniref:SWIM-type domain-containing protein n=1 Tax=Phytophthora nicotianae (strain INRA-310) TaxID=761204 RepID=W2QR63_PHYN3|nr:hypothetical protein PPTG_07032 [Phytophthora nicotianae INRA-310]ETN14745.1 hypothetical protein PPTG_07032 [Phytophthora nicotianae INRA-310]